MGSQATAGVLAPYLGCCCGTPTLRTASCSLNTVWPQPALLLLLGEPPVTQSVRLAGPAHLPSPLKSSLCHHHGMHVLPPQAMADRT